jgi:hypothetical protein
LLDQRLGDEEAKAHALLLAMACLPTRGWLAPPRPRRHIRFSDLLGDFREEARAIVEDFDGKVVVVPTRPEAHFMCREIGGVFDKIAETVQDFRSTPDLGHDAFLHIHDNGDIDTAMRRGDVIEQCAHGQAFGAAKHGFLGLGEPCQYGTAAFCLGAKQTKIIGVGMAGQLALQLARHNGNRPQWRSELVRRCGRETS